MRDAGALVGQRGLGARSDRRDPPPRHARAGADRRRIDIVTGVGRDARGRAGAGREVPGPAPRRPRLRAGVDAQPGGAAPAQRHRSRRAALRRGSPARSSTPTPRCAPTPACSRATGAASRACGATRSRATCRSCCCGSATRRNIELVRQLVQAHAYWRLKGLAVDLVIWNEDRGGYRQVLQDQIMGLIAAGRRGARDRPAGRHLRAPRRADLRRGPHPAAGGGARRSSPTAAAALAEQVERRAPARAARSRALAPTRARASRAGATPPRRRARDLILVNGLGGFTRRRPRVRHHAPRAGRRRRRRGSTCSPIRTSARVVSESGAAYTWCENAHEFRLTPWHNDPVSDAERRGVLPARRGDAATSGRRRRCPRRGAGAVRDAPRLRLQRLRARRGRHRHRAARCTSRSTRR